MLVTFLDIDGVLNSERFGRKLEERHRQLGHGELASTTCDCFAIEKQIDAEAVERLNRLVTTTRSKIVISSSWRKLFDLAELARILGEHGLVGEIIGETPDGNDPEMLAEFEHLDRIFRGHEIDLWLRRHPEVTRFVILDDGGDMAMHKGRLVQTDAEEGLLDEHVDLAIAMLRGPSRNRQNSYRWDEIGGHVVSTVRLPPEWEEALGAKYETLVYSIAARAWDLDGDGVHSENETAADAAHEAACTRLRGGMQ